jgi:hypothetical protein
MKRDLFDLIKKLSEAERKAVSAEAFIYKKMVVIFSLNFLH